MERLVCLEKNSKEFWGVFMLIVKAMLPLIMLLCGSSGDPETSSG